MRGKDSLKDAQQKEIRRQLPDGVFQELVVCISSYLLLLSFSFFLPLVSFLSFLWSILKLPLGLHLSIQCTE